VSTAPPTTTPRPGENINAQTALQWGVVSEVVPHERALERGIEIARSLASKLSAVLASG
jgi:enoyl-CoA hydratase/carnithine racemase